MGKYGGRVFFCNSVMSPVRIIFAIIMAVNNIQEEFIIMTKRFKSALVILILILMAGSCEALIRYGNIDRKPGLTFEGLQYSFRSLNLTVRNRTKYNVNFGGTMIFLDKNYKIIAKAELLNAKIKRHSSRKYKAFFTYGSGHEAERAKYLEWEF